VKVRAYQCDVSDAERVTHVFKDIDEKMGPIQGLVAVRVPLSPCPHALACNS
jgi:enoyl-[acyl-carrier-protein] reductase (NADH)